MAKQSKNLAFLEYSFLFDPTETWQYLSKFESDLAKFFGSLGYQAEIIRTVEGQVGRRILYIRKVKQDLIDQASIKKPRP